MTMSQSGMPADDIDPYTGMPLPAIQQPGLMPQPPMPPMPVPPPYYWIARVMAERRNDAVKYVHKGIDRACDEFVGKLDAMQLALGLVKQRDPKLRLQAYYSKPDTYAEAVALQAIGEIPVVYSWESQKAKFPRDFDEQWKDFQRLRLRASRGELGPELQAQEVAYMAASNMQPGMEADSGLGIA